MILPRWHAFVHAALMPLRRAYLRHIWGCKVGAGSIVAFSAVLDRTAPRCIEIGDFVRIEDECLIMTHDSVNARHAPTRIGDNCHIGMRSVIGTGVKVGANCIIEPGSVVLTDVRERSRVAGNPARIVERDIATGRWGVRLPGSVH